MARMLFSFGSMKSLKTPTNKDLIVRLMSTEQLELRYIDAGGKLITKTAGESKDGIPGARKDDTGKAAVFQGVVQYFPRALMAVAGISDFGAAKYARGGWKYVPDGYNRYSDALARHLLLKESGELVDEESSLLHDAHLAWNALARLELYLMEKNDANPTSK
jgi:hypothetical protein